MRIFLTGATGFVGSHTVPELLAAGHEVIGLTRSERGAAHLAAAGAQAHFGTLADADSLRDGAERADAVIHTAFDHDFANYVENCRADADVIALFGSVLRGSDRPLIVTSATGMGDPGDGSPALESIFDADHPIPRVATERAANAVLEMGVDVRVVRLPQVHDPVKQGLVSLYIDHVRAAGSVPYVGDGSNRWCAAHVSDVARLYSLVLAQGERGARYHAVAEEGVAFRDIAEAVAKGLDLPLRSVSAAEAPEHLSWLTMFVGIDMVASSAWTRLRLGWTPVGPDLLADLAAMDYRLDAAVS
ncbi:NAD-dependent dehydratase [Sphingomonas spermidinifaciens]|uniref:NAD-dependent dehydratase n=1 Tax=Sphingomonas spermidinifaciens TaxID=1141889 RepID=A0A2A4B2L5_9SPHN|nr:SDR family oxidoreductase [Sphingomonas spermidinifaciens]PCD02182.1 NAD-dependent dehydratase [Sphingomonas spermidinifaciens]